MIDSRICAAALALSLAVFGGSTVTVGPAQAAATVCRSGVPGDVNGDGHAEVAVSSQQPDAVHVFYGSAAGLRFDAKGSARNDQRFTQATPGMPGTVDPDDAFGHATALGDFDADGCADLAISALSDSNGWGSVTVLYGSPKGLTTKGVIRLSPQGNLPAEQWQSRMFGYKLDVGDLTGDGIDDLAVGAPNAIAYGEDEPYHFGTGAVVVYTGGTTGLSAATNRRIVVTGDDIADPTSGPSLYDFAIGDFDGVGADELAVNARRIGVVSFGPTGVTKIDREVVDDRGEHLVAGDTDGDGKDDLAFTGSPFDRNGVVLLLGSAAGLGPDRSREWSYADLGLESEELNLAMGRLDVGSTDDLVIGCGACSVGRVNKAGEVRVLFGGSAGPTLSGMRKIDQSTAGVPGSAEDHDLFGGAVATAYVQGRSQANVIVGAIKEKTGSTREAGRVTVFPWSAAGPKSRGSIGFDLNTAGVQGRSAKGSRFGYALGGPNSYYYRT